LSLEIAFSSKKIKRKNKRKGYFGITLEIVVSSKKK